MTEDAPDILLTRLNEFVSAQMGLYFPKERRRDLKQGIDSAARAFNFTDAESCIRWLLSSPLTKSQIEILARYLTVGETYFFREEKSFEMLETRLLPDLIRSRREKDPRVRIWSAGCCTGEEPYSIAMLLQRLIPDLKDWNVTILGTDINPYFLRKASDGIYNEWSFRGTAAWIKDRYFTRTQAGSFEILPEIKKRVTFSFLNLAEDTYPSLTNNTNAMDIIFCRNVLMYFAPERAKQVIRSLYHSLIDGGWLIVSPSETSQVLFPQFVTVNFPGLIFYQRTDGDPSRTGQAVEALPDTLVNGPGGSFQPPVHFLTERAPEAILPHETRELLPSRGDAQSTRRQQPAPYAEASVLYEQGRYAEASEQIVGWLQGRPDDAKAMVLLARVYANQGHLAEAFRWCEQAIAADKLAAGGHYLLATILQEMGRVEEAVVSLKRALYLDPSFVLAHFSLGNLTRQRGRPKESAKHFENALSLLDANRADEILPESEGMTAGRLKEIIRSTAYRETAA